jgi:hypothetical protein
VRLLCRVLPASFHAPRSVLVACVSFDGSGILHSKTMREWNEMRQQQQPLLSKLHIFDPPSASAAARLWAVEEGGGHDGRIRTRGTCTPSSPAVGRVSGMTCSGQLCCVTRHASSDDHADGGGQCWLVTFDTFASCGIVYNLSATLSTTLHPAPSPLPPSSICTDGFFIHVLTHLPSSRLELLSPAHPSTIVDHTSFVSRATALVPALASHVACAPTFSLLSSISTGYMLPPPPSCSRSAACHHPAHLPLIPIPSAMSRDLACALHPGTFSLICWGDASIAAIVPAFVVCVSDGEQGCKSAALNGGGAGYQLAPRLYDSTHSDGRFVDIMPAPLKGVGGQMCDSTTDIARISVLSVSFSPSTSLCNQSSCSCTM